MAPLYGGMPKIIVVTERSAVFGQLSGRLGFPTGAANRHPPSDPTGGQAADPPREWSYESSLDDLPIPDPATA